jgi:hypothetical protein
MTSIKCNNPYDQFPAAGGSCDENAAMPTGTHTKTFTVTWFDGADAWSRFKFDNDGKVYTSGDTGTPSWVYLHDWTDTPSASVGDGFEIKYERNGDTTPAAGATTLTESTYADLSTDQTIGERYRIFMGKPVSPGGTTTTTNDITIRCKADTSNTDTETYANTAGTT